MVVFGRFKKPKSPIILGSPEEDTIISPQTPATPATSNPPVLRNFSYPTSVASGIKTPTLPKSDRTTQTSWDQLGDICSFSPNSPPRAVTALEDPFFFRSDESQYTPIPDEEDQAHSHGNSSHINVTKASSKAEPSTRKKQRRSALLGLSTGQSQNTSLFTRSSNTPRTRTKVPRSHSLGDHIFPYTSSVTARLKRNSLGQHKVTSSFDASQLAIFQSTTPDRPASSTGVPVVDTRLKLANSPIGPPPLNTSQSSPADPLNVSTEASNMDPSFRKESGISSSGIVGRIRGNSTAEYDKRKCKEGKGRWLAQIKDWVSVSEPSTQALKQHKMETYKRAGIALDDPRANAKLHLPSSTLPPDAIKPSGRGPEPEEIARMKAEQRKRRQSFLVVEGTSQGSQDSSMSSLPLQEYRDVF